MAQADIDTFADRTGRRRVLALRLVRVVAGSGVPGLYSSAPDPSDPTWTDGIVNGVDEYVNSYDDQTEVMVLTRTPTPPPNIQPQMCQMPQIKNFFAMNVLSPSMEICIICGSVTGQGSRK